MRASACKRSLDGRCRLSRMEAQILAHFKLHAVDLREKPRHRSPVVHRIRFGVAEVCHLSLKVGDTVQSHLELLIIRYHGYSPMARKSSRPPLIGGTSK